MVTYKLSGKQISVISETADGVDLRDLRVPGADKRW